LPGLLPEVARNEQIKGEVAAIKRHATVIAIKRQALDAAPRVHRKLPLPKRPRPVFIFPSRYAKLVRSFACL
jgi:hypothetical protein